jgi:hypothetical protein
MSEQTADGQEQKAEFRGARFEETGEQIDVVDVEEIAEEGAH